METKKSNKKKNSFDKKEFISILSSMTDTEINEFIKKNGKKAKGVSPFIILK